MGLQIPVLSPATQDAIRQAVAPEASVVNPVDMIATAVGPQYEVALRATAADPGIDAVIVIFTSLESIDSRKVAEGILRGAHGAGKPVLVCFMGKVSQRESVEALKSAGLPVYTFPEEAALALGALLRYRRWIERPIGYIPAFADFDSGCIRGIFAGVRQAGRTQLTLAEAQHVFEACGIRVAPWREVGDAGAARRAAADLGWPVVLKLSSATIVHKSEMGGVRLNVRAADDVEAAAGEMLDAARAIDPAATLVVQTMATGGTEVIFGASVDPKFGPLMMFGLGGIFVEILKDVAFRVHPITDVDAGEMVAAIKSFPILRGARGHQPVHLAALKETLLRLNQLLTEFPEIQELDINPFFAHAEPAQNVAADARIALTRVGRTS
jgi:acetyltransferase